MPPLTVHDVRCLLRGLQAFHAYYEESHQDTITSADGRTWCLWDVERIYRASTTLAPRQRAAIELCLYHDLREQDVALGMGLGENTPVLVYAAEGIKTLIRVRAVSA